mgnify:FL=1
MIVIGDQNVMHNSADIGDCFVRFNVVDYAGSVHTACSVLLLPRNNLLLIN